MSSPSELMAGRASASSPDGDGVRGRSPRENVTLHRHGAAVGDHHHPRAHGGAAVLDIGGDVGALVVLLDPGTEGTELHVRAEGVTGSTIHTGVWERHQGDGHVTAALFYQLDAGRWFILDEHGDDAAEVTITGGALATVDLRAASAGSP